MKKLVQFRFGEKGIQIIEDLKKDLDFSSRAEVIRLALNLLNWVNDNLKNGYEINAIKCNKKDVKAMPKNKLSIWNIFKGGFSPASEGRKAAREHMKKIKGGK